MLVTKHAAELCALLVNDLYGELPSRILIALLTKGRSTIPQLVQQTSLNTRHLRNGLGVLFHQNLLYARTEPGSKTTTYEANPDACYNLIRSGKILEVLEQRFGAAERDLVQTLMLLGHARIQDLGQAFSTRAPQANGETNGSHSMLIGSESRLRSVLARLLQAEIVEAVRADTFRNPAEVLDEYKQEMAKASPGDRISNKDKIVNDEKAAERYIAFRDNGKAIKRQLDQTRGSYAKRRKLQNGHSTNGDHIDDDDAPHLNPNIIVRVNYEKCLVELRNHRLVAFASDSIGETTASVYRTVLDLATAHMSRCRIDPLAAVKEPEPTPITVTTLDIFDHLDEGIDVARGIGKVSGDKIDTSSVEKVKMEVPQSDDESDIESDDDGPVPNGRSNTRPRGNTVQLNDEDPFSESDNETRTKGERPSRVTFDDSSTNRTARIEQMRQHLLLLKDSKHRFIRHCGTQGRGQWTVDFRLLMARFRDAEMDAVIEQSFGRHGLRLTRILRERGKLDEKMLYSSALMKKGDVQGKMLAMQMAGLVDIQEVPRDTNRLANRTLFFWHFDGEKTQAQLLDDIYKAMLRCMQTLQVERHKERNILSFVERKDVQGKEEEVMTAEHYNKYNSHLEVQDRLLGQVMRLDDMVSVLRDF
ncbi:hypothetical protein V2G26_001153 [Clonostachys chloroleuca]